jgi:RHS repeat-associated protein
VNNRTPSVSSGGTTSGGYSPFPNPHSPTIPVAGLFFIHPDHLGSTTMITDGYGNPVSGGEYGGKSHISYKPYGEILRTDSGGPDITKFKYTGQIEDKETGLMYYKARYYDPMLARFTQADSMVFNDQVSGMNRYMYVSGNPVKYRDPSGHKLSHAQSWALAGYFISGGKIEWAIAGYMQGKGLDRKDRRNSAFHRRAFTEPNPNRKLYDKYKYAIAAYYMSGGDPEIVSAAYEYGSARDLKKKNSRTRAQAYARGLGLALGGLIYGGLTNDWINAKGAIVAGVGIIGDAYNQNYSNVRRKIDRSRCLLITKILEEDRSTHSIFSEAKGACYVNFEGEGNK